MLESLPTEIHFRDLACNTSKGAAHNENAANCKSRSYLVISPL